MQRELDGLSDIPDEEFMDQDEQDEPAEANDEDMEVEAEAASKKLEVRKPRRIHLITGYHSVDTLRRLKL
jgi:hypothetical protein